MVRIECLGYLFFFRQTRPRLERRCLLRQRCLDFGRIDIFASGDDEIIAPIEYVKKSVSIEAADVAGVQPSVNDRARRCIGSLEISRSDDGPAYENLSLFGICCIDANFVRLQCLARRAQPPLRILG